MAVKKEENDSDDLRPFSREERRKIRRLLESEERIKWFWGTIRVWATWISGTIMATYGLFEVFRNIWRQ